VPIIRTPEPLLPVRLVALDIDGTLLRSDKTLSPRTREAVARARSSGVRVVLVTGRRHPSARKVADELGEALPLVVHNGALVIEDGRIIRCRPLGALVMKDEAGGDEKIIAVPVDALHPIYSGIRSYKELPPIICDQISHFFQHYKDLEPGKWVSIARWLDVEDAQALVMKAIERAKAAQASEPG
jgi:hypothetical protein